MIVEHGALVIVSLVLGFVLGVVLSAAVLPLISVNQDGSSAALDVEVVLPWLSIAAVVASVLVVVLLVVGLLAMVLRRIGLGALLRLGDDS